MSIPMKRGSSEKYDYEYVRNETANIFMAVEFKAGKRVTRVTRKRRSTGSLRGSELIRSCLSIMSKS
jgi:hypothetical protein